MKRRDFFSALLSWLPQWFVRPASAEPVVYYYPAGNDEIKARMIELAKANRNNTWVVWPRSK